MASSATPAFPEGLNKPICVFCGSSPGKSPIHADAARAVGQAMAAQDVPLVYGGGRRGIMGVVSQAALEAGGYVHGIVPRALITRASERTSAPTVDPLKSTQTGSDPAKQVKSAEGAGEDLVDDDYDGRLTMSITESMHDRKLKMAQLSTGGFICLPGGYGTFEEALEMITWNQLKIHQLPVVMLNIDNFYTPLQTLYDSASSAGFINPENLSLVKIVNLPGGAEDNADPTKAGEWGQAALDAIKGFTFSANAGYNLSWKTSRPEASTSSTPSTEPKSESESKSETFSLFTTLRYTSPLPEPRLRVEKQHVPLIDRHIARLRTAQKYFSERDGGGVWGDWPGDGNVWQKVKMELEEGEKKGGGDWRVRVLLHRDADIEVQLIPASPTAGGFDLNLPPHPSKPRRRLILDPSPTHISPEDPSIPFRLNKTTSRDIYTAPTAPYPPGTEVLLHTPDVLLETCTSNVALHIPGGPGEAEWVTPKVSVKAAFLAGTVRAELLERGVIREGEVTVADWMRCREEKRGVVGFNGFVGVWQADFEDNDDGSYSA